jgi:uncharacterized protein (DUF2336 family)
MTKSAAYPPLDGLLDLACRDGIEIRPTLLRVLTDLYVQKPSHSAEEETQYVELALGLIEAVDAPTRAAVVASLSTYPAAPAAILRKLADTLPPPGSDSPTRAESESHDLVEMFFAADSEERRLILANLDVAAEATSRRPAPVANELIRRLETAALQRNTGEFGRVLERALGISHALAERIARDHFGEPIVVAARALGMKAAVLQRILLFLNPVIGQSVERVHHLARLFDELAPEAAERMLAIWRKAGGQSRPVYEAAHWDDERHRARSPSTPARQDPKKRAPVFGIMLKK